MFGSVLFGAGGLTLAFFVLGSDPFADWRLDRRPAEARGRLEHFEAAGPGRYRDASSGQIVKTRDRAILTARLGDEPSEAVLYDPARPERALLLDGLSLPVRRTRAGGWEDPGLAPRLQLAFAGLCFGAGGVPLAWTVWLLLR